ncbi:MAG: hypothetical protein AABY32_00180 [Nanoarchaeota archaeon]
MVEKTVEEKVKVNNIFELLRAPENSWVEINGKDEFKIHHPSLGSATTIYLEGKFVCENNYETFLASMTPFHTEKFLIGTGGAVDYLKILRDKGGLDFNA